MRPLPPSQPESGAWVVAGPKSALARLSPLLEAHSRCRPVRVVETSPLSTQQLDTQLQMQPHLQLQSQTPQLPINDAASLLIIGDPRRSPRTALPGIFVRATNGRRVPTGWLPNVGDRLSDYARAAAEVQLRTIPEPLCQNEEHICPIQDAHLHQIPDPKLRQVSTAALGPFVLLGEFTPRALQWAEWFSDELAQHSAIFQWTAERITRPNLVAGLRFGAAAVFYFGHGTPNGWFGYGGFDKSDALAASDRPIGCIISFSCSVARRPHQSVTCPTRPTHQSMQSQADCSAPCPSDSAHCTNQISADLRAQHPVHKLSFCEDLVLSGLCAAAIGSTRLSLHHRNVEWSLALSKILCRRRSTRLCDLLSDPALPLPALNSYRILGDPMAQLIGDPECAFHSKKIFAPAPTDTLPIIPLSA
jgi:hypothetical protein